MSLFVRKDIGALLAEAGAGTLRRELGPLALVTLGIGAVIGAGIFVLSGTVASQNAGPALTLSMVFAGIACVFAGLCYAELASMIPVAGSAGGRGHDAAQGITDPVYAHSRIDERNVVFLQPR